MSDARSVTVWSALCPRLEGAPHVCLVCAFDGVLAPYVDKPEEARVIPRARAALARLARGRRVTVAVASGRTLEDMHRRVGLEGLWYIGLHGGEIRSPEGEEWRFFDREDLEFMRDVAGAFETEVAGIRGALVEPVGPTVVVHCRRVADADIPKLTRKFLAVAARYPKLMITMGHETFEARPRGPANLSMALRHLRRHGLARAVFLYVGDPCVQRPLFETVRAYGIAVAVGDATAGEYTLSDGRAAVDLLRDLAGVFVPRTTRRRPRLVMRPRRILDRP